MMWQSPESTKSNDEAHKWERNSTGGVQVISESRLEAHTLYGLPIDAVAKSVP